MKKIIVFASSTTIGGIERVLLTYAEGLADKKYDVTFLSAVDKSGLEISKYSNIKFHCLNVTRLRYTFWQLVKYFKKEKPDIIFTANDQTLIIFLAKMISCSAKLITSHHNYYEKNPEAKLRQWLIIKYIYPLCSNIIAVSDGIATMLNEQFGINKEKIKTLYNPIDTSLIINLSKEKKNDIPKNDFILFLGRLSAVKNLPLLLSAFALFNKKYKEISLLLIGDGEEKEKTLNLIKKMNLSDAVTLLGIRSNPYPYIKEAEIVVLSSISEALPTVLLESMLLGKTIVSTPTKGALDVLKNGKFGYISKSIKEINDYSEKLIMAYENPLEKEMLTNEVINNYNLEMKISEFEKIFYM